MSMRHLSDDQLAEACLVPEAPAETFAHLLSCPACQARHTTLTRVLTEVSTAATVEADAVFSDEWLIRQRTRILHRVEMDGRPAKVIAFPASAIRETTLRHTRPAARWVAAGAAAGLAIGLLTGQFVHRLPVSLRMSQVNATPSAGTQAMGSPAIRTISATNSDDEFLAQIEVAGGSGGPATLRPLDALTPRAWDVR